MSDIPEVYSAESIADELVTSSTDSLLETEDDKPFVVASSFAVSRKRRYYFSAFEPEFEDEEEEAEPSAKKSRFSDLLLAPITPQQTLFGTSAPQIHLQLGDIMEINNQESSENVGETSLTSENETSTDEPVLPQPEMPSFFPSLFGRSLAIDNSPVKSPEKYGGIYQTIFKDLLHNVKLESEELVDQVMPMHFLSDEPIEDISSLCEPETVENSFCVDENALAIHNLVTDLLIKLTCAQDNHSETAVNFASDEIDGECTEQQSL
uniref:Uncharacterized protein n=1 Tax=Panagrolaimus superbus TaxID=310955 RepID=A0A914YND5_9BILA